MSTAYIPLKRQVGQEIKITWRPWPWQRNNCYWSSEGGQFLSRQDNVPILVDTMDATNSEFDVYSVQQHSADNLQKKKFNAPDFPFSIHRLAGNNKTNHGHH